MKGSRPLADEFREIVSELVTHIFDHIHPMMEIRPVKHRAVIVVASDKGLCGSYNNSILRTADAFLRSLEPGNLVHLVVFGQKARRFLLRRDYTFTREYVNWNPEFPLASEMAQLAQEWYTSGEVDEVRCFYTRSVSGLIQQPVGEVLLPFEPKDGSTHKQAPYIFEPNPREVLDRILPIYLQVYFLQILREARAAELGARLRAMTNATDNADKVIDALTLKFFWARQDAITREIIEVASGANAMAAGI